MDDGGAPGSREELPNRLQHRVVGLLAAVALDTLAARDAPPQGGRGLALELVDQGGLPDARLSRDEDELPLVSHRQPEAVAQRVERARPAYQTARCRFGDLPGGAHPP